MTVGFPLETAISDRSSPISVKDSKTEHDDESDGSGNGVLKPNLRVFAMCMKLLRPKLDYFEYVLRCFNLWELMNVIILWVTNWMFPSS
jgi:hypothetical protein